MKYLTIFLAIYVVIHDPLGDKYISYDGQATNQIDSMLSSGPSYEYISKDTFNSAVEQKRIQFESLKDKDKDKIDSIKSQIADPKLKIEDRFNKLVEYLGISL